MMDKRMQELVTPGFAAAQLKSRSTRRGIRGEPHGSFEQGLESRSAAA